MATIRDVAKRANVSVATVSRYLNGAQLRKDNRARIAEAIDELRYQPNLIGRAFATAHSYTVGILINSATNPFAGSLMGLIERELERLGYAAVFVEYQGDADFLRETDVPLVLVDNPLVGPSADSIVVDNCEAVRKAVGAMLDAGHRRVGLVAMLPHTHVGAERARGWRLAFEERGLCADEGLVRACDNVKDAAALATDELLGAGATAVFACNYYLELGALKSMLRRSLRPGIDVGFAGFDEIDFADIFDPVPTCVIQPIVAIASLAASLLVGRIGRGFAPDGIHCLACEVRITDSILGGLPA
ncbi:LacI family DNA-binding transcriptional regulator [Parolsenella catena]|uniref:LacI family DNA-binding transcriptional regulator n=1 Tax=Parolsenella catena TaxID=2003188 RepID=UPI003077259F